MSKKAIDQESVDELIGAIRSISHGGLSGPMGLEMLAMAVSGDGNGAPLAQAVGEGLNEIAGAISTGLTEIAEAIQESSAKGNKKGSK